MFFLFIFESIGTSELLLIGVVALIIFGPRKMPELAKMLAKTMNEFKKATNDFKQTWEREVDLESLKDLEPEPPKTISQTPVVLPFPENKTLAAPAIREISEADFPGLATATSADAPETVSNQVPPTEDENPPGKQDWL